MDTALVLDDCSSQQVRALIEEHNRGVDYLTKVDALLKSAGIQELPPVPRKITLKRRT